MKKILVIFSLLAATSVYAGNEIGNGGDGIVCRTPDGRIRHAEVADYYEAKNERGIDVDLGPGAKWQDKVAFGLKRLARLDPTRSQELSFKAAQFLANARMISGHEFPDISDTGGMIVPSGCKVEQAVIQQVPQFPQDKTFLINQDLWNAFDETSKAGLVIHELLYQEALARYHAINSRKARYLNSLIASKDLDALGLNDYIAILAAAEFYSYELHTRLNKMDVVISLKLGECQDAGELSPRRCENQIEIRNGLLAATLGDDRGIPVIFQYVNGQRREVEFEGFQTKDGRTEGFNFEYGTLLLLPENRSELSFAMQGDGFHIELSGNLRIGAQPGIFSVDPDGVLLEEVPLPCAQALVDPILGRGADWEQIDVSVRFSGNNTLQCGPNSDPMLKVVSALGTEGGTVELNSSWLLVSDVASLIWKWKGTRYRISRKMGPGCAPGYHARLRFEFENLTWWSNALTCFDISTERAN